MTSIGPESDGATTSILSPEELLELLAPVPPTTGPPKTGPLSPDELRYVARLVANQAGFGYDVDEGTLITERHGAGLALAARGLRETDAEEFVLSLLGGNVAIEGDAGTVPPDEAFAALGALGEQATAVAFVITTLLKEGDIALDPLATDDERDEARACRWDGFTFLSQNFPRAIEDAQGVASVAADIEARRMSE